MGAKGILSSMLPRLSRSVATAAYNTDQYRPDGETGSAQVAKHNETEDKKKKKPQKNQSCTYSLSRGWEGGAGKTAGRWRTMCGPGPGERRRDEGTTRGVTHKHTTLSCQTDRHLKATTSHAFICRCYDDATRQNLKITKSSTGTKPTLEEMQRI